VVGKENIISFVRQTLGCNCPEEVFSTLDCRTDSVIQGIALDMKINVGNRLLIYIITIEDPDSIRRILPVLFASGKKERDGAGFNRFRLVVAADDISMMQKEAEQVFGSLDRDEKVHVHVISRKRIPHCPTG
jgi:hypothetical protein